MAGPDTRERGQGAERLWLLLFGVLVAGGLVTALLLSRGNAGPPVPTFSPTAPEPSAPDAATPGATASEPTDPPRPTTEPTASPTTDERKARFGPVHGIARRGSAVLLAAEDGLWLVTDDGDVEPAEGPRHRFSALARQGDTLLLASGLSEQGRPLGLVTSRDDGRTWQEASLGGQAAFKRVVAAGDRVFGWDAGSGRLLATGDLRTWEERSTQQGVFDFAVSGDDPSRMVRAVPEGGVGLPEVQESRDGGRTWDRIAAPSLFLFDWHDGGTLWGLTEDGTVFVSEDDGYSWSPRSILPAPPTAFLSTTEVQYAALRDVGLYRSTDGARTWHRLDTPA